MTDKAPESGPVRRVHYLEEHFAVTVKGLSTDPQAAALIDSAVRRALRDLDVFNVSVGSVAIRREVGHNDRDMTEALMASVKR